MSTSPLPIESRRSWALTVRAALYDGLFTSCRGYWLLRLMFAVLLGWTMNAAFESTRPASCDRDVLERALFLVVLPLGWFLFPLPWRRSMAARTVTFHGEGLSVESASSSFSVAWGAVRAIRRTIWDLVVVLDGSTVAVPRSVLPAGAMESVAARWSHAREVAATDDPPPRPQIPYRTADTLPPRPEDEEAVPREWVMPAHYGASVLAFPTRWDHVCALLSLKPGARKWPAIVVGVGAVLAGIATAPLLAGVSPFMPMALIGAVIALLGAAPPVLGFARALMAGRDRFVRERSAGVLYAVGPHGLYVRTHQFERRDAWSSPVVVRTSRRRVAILNGTLDVHVIPTKAFASAEARDAFAKTLERRSQARRAPRPSR